MTSTKQARDLDEGDVVHVPFAVGGTRQMVVKDWGCYVADDGVTLRVAVNLDAPDYHGHYMEYNGTDEVTVEA